MSPGRPARPRPFKKRGQNAARGRPRQGGQSRRSISREIRSVVVSEKGFGGGQYFYLPHRYPLVGSGAAVPGQVPGQVAGPVPSRAIGRSDAALALL